jgi:mono/diheme cytochrome c family protein
VAFVLDAMVGPARQNMRWSGILLFFAVSAWAQQSNIDFSRDIQPVFEARCLACHGAGQQMAGLRLDSGDAVVKGGTNGPVVQAGNSAGSKLIERVTSSKKGFAMPPVGDPLSADQVAKLRAWIDQGAKVPATAAAVPGAPAKSRHWAFQPVVRPSPPEVRNGSWARNPVDRFILARLEGEGYTPSPEADRVTLIRRVSLDLIGLPPSPAEVADFVADTRPDAYDRVVDRLLASPHYGEKWGRHWLDLARYGDSDGYERDPARPNAWRYRQWVIEALNRDMPYDEFTIEQLAGDLLPNASVEQRVATGFQRNTFTNREAGVDRAEDRFEQLVNRTNTVGTVWLGLTVGCAQCHNHKFDPISQKEFYQMLSFWNPVEEVDIEAPLPGETGPYLRALPEYQRKRTELLEKYGIPDMAAQWESKLREAHIHAGKDVEWDYALTEFRAGYDPWKKILDSDVAHRSRRMQDNFVDFFVESGHSPDLEKDKAAADRLKQAREQLAALKATLPPYSEAPVMAQMSSPPETHIAVGGDFRNPGDKVEPGTLAVMPALQTSGNLPPRLLLARWIVSRENPLTARVAVNRMWQEYFGRGLVRTSEDFGTQGEKPSHPELLDWLATEFMDRGWSMKAIHRTIVTSATYRQSSKVRKEIQAKDPDNVLLSRQSRLRLPAELIRDAALASSGLLNPAIGGRSIKPPQPAGVAELTYGNGTKWKESEGPDRYRRGLYIHFQRTSPYPELISFDAPDSRLACTRRRRSNTPLQALNLLNDPVFIEAAQALAVRTLRESSGAFQDKLGYAFELALNRKPKARETADLTQYFNEQKAVFQKDEKAVASVAPFTPDGVDRLDMAAWVGLSRVLMNLDEFITRE